LQVLQTHIAAAQISGETARPEPRAALEALADRVEQQCRRLHGKYVSSSAGLRDVPAAIRNLVVPPLAQGPRTGRPLKMGLTKAGGARGEKKPAASPASGSRRAR
jgi:hypothetical protein